MGDIMREWIKPKLVILERNKFEEQVLTSCKVGGEAGYDSNFLSCNYEIACLQCELIAPS